MIKKILLIIACFVLSFATIQNVVFADDAVYLGGYPAGFSLYSKGAFVVGVCDVVTKDGLKSPCKDAGIDAGDLILSINEKETNTSLDIENAIKDEKKHIAVIERGEETLIKEFYPAKDLNGKYRLGVFTRDTVNGIGTITYIKDKTFASLGHPVLDENNNVMKINGGSLFKCAITDCVKGERGKPGELRGAFLKRKEIGKIFVNEENGVYGKLDDCDLICDNLTKISFGKAKMGDAKIFTTISGVEPQEYDISIVKVDEFRNDSKNLVVKITDERLLSLTGGIVQGMSGSPIVQNGKLVGAITHVFINDPTRGFGLFIQNMNNY